MLSGIGLLAVIIAAITASLVESSRERFTAQSDEDDTRQFNEISVDWQGSKRYSSSRRPRDQPMGPADDHSIRSCERGAGSGNPGRARKERASSRIRRLFSRSRELERVVYRDPEHVADRLTLYTADLLGRRSVGTG